MAFVMLLLYVLVSVSTANGIRAPALRWRASRDVVTAQGIVRGYLRQKHYAFLGIPYARPPTLDDRFKAPEAPASWDGIFEATHRVSCPQISKEGDENCLVTNVFVPEGVAECCPLPVMVHVHDGEFHNGYGSLNPPRGFLADYIIVTFNYRLGALGFLCLGNPGAPGNAGLKDQVAALYWIQQNIANFRGNHADVTLYGTGSGAISIQLLILSGLAKGLFNRVILDSGSVISPATLSYDPYATALNIATTLGYNDVGDTEMLVDFYRNLSIQDLVNISTNFLPCIESRSLYAHNLIDQDPVKILKEGSFEKIPMLVVYTDAKELKLIEDNYSRFTIVPDNFQDLLPSNLDFGDGQIRYKIADLVRTFYFEETEISENVVQNYKDYINDIFMEYPIYKFAILYASKTTVPVFVMKFAYNAESNDYDSSMYGDVFKIIFAEDDLTDEDAKISDILKSLFKNFIKIGDPTPLTTELIPVVWEPLNPQGADFVSISQPCLIIRSTLTMSILSTSYRLAFWDRIYTKYYRKHYFDRE